MKVILFGASGMVGQGVLLECLKDSGVTQVLVIGRSSIGKNHEKIKEALHKDFSDFTSLKETMTGFDACFFCLGVSSVGMSEQDYTYITYGFTLAAAKILAQVNPGSVFIYVSGEGTDSTEQGNSMWARVKGKTENDVAKLFPGKACAFRPGAILPYDGILPKNRSLKILLRVLWPLLAILRWFPSVATDTRTLGRAMIRVVRDGAPPIANTSAINRLGGDLK